MIPSCYLYSFGITISYSNKAEFLPVFGHQALPHPKFLDNTHLLYFVDNLLFSEHLISLCHHCLEPSLSFMSFMKPESTPTECAWARKNSLSMLETRTAFCETVYSLTAIKETLDHQWYRLLCFGSGRQRYLGYGHCQKKVIVTVQG